MIKAPILSLTNLEATLKGTLEHHRLIGFVLDLFPKGAILYHFCWTCSLKEHKGAIMEHT